jgi:hypothetical protein
MESFEELKKLILELELDAKKCFEKQNKSAGIRLRKGLQDVKSLAQTIRIEVSNVNKHVDSGN